MWYYVKKFNLITPPIEMAGIALKRSVHNRPVKGVDKRSIFDGETKSLEDVEYIANFVPLWIRIMQN